jgi:MFS family permease
MPAFSPMRLFRLDPEAPADRNAWYLVVEIFWASMMAAAAAFNAAYAMRLGASNTEVGFLSSLPALLAVIVSIPAGRFLQSRTQRKPWILASLTATRMGYLLVALVPLLHISGVSQGMISVMVLVGLTIPAHFFNVGWIAMLADVIHEDRRATVFAARNIIYNASFSLFVLLFGIWLNAVPHPFNYQVMYIFGFLTSLLSVYFIIRIEMPTAPIIAEKKTPPVSLRSLLHVMRAHPAFMRINLNTLMHGIGVWAAAPLYMLYYVRDLNADEAWIGLQATIGSLATIAGFAFWRWLMKRWGESRTLKVTIMLAGVMPLLVGATGSLTFILFVVAFNGWMAGGIALSHFNTLLKSMPADARPEFTALYQTVMNIGAFLCPIIGVALANQFGNAAVLVACGVLVLIGSSSFTLFPVKIGD